VKALFKKEKKLLGGGSWVRERSGAGASRGGIQEKPVHVSHFSQNGDKLFLGGKENLEGEKNPSVPKEKGDRGEGTPLAQRVF